MPDTLSHTLGRTKEITYKGKLYNIEPLDLNDIADLEDRIVDIALLDPSKPKMLRLLLWAVLRKSDPTLTEYQKQNGEYNLTEYEVGRMIPISGLQDPETQQFVLTVMRQSGLLPDENEDNTKNESAETEKEATVSEASA